MSVPLVVLDKKPSRSVIRRYLRRARNKCWAQDGGLCMACVLAIEETMARRALVRENDLVLIDREQRNRVASRNRTIKKYIPAKLSPAEAKRRRTRFLNNQSFTRTWKGLRV